MRTTAPAGDYPVQTTDGTVLAAVERESLENLAATLAHRTLAFQPQTPSRAAARRSRRRSSLLDALQNLEPLMAAGLRTNTPDS
jgi:hypothetical protein